MGIWNEDSLLLQGARQLEERGFLVRPGSYEDFLMTMPGGTE